MADGPAADAGLKVEDAILSIDAKQIEDSRDLARTIADLPAKATVDVKVWRNKGEQTVKVKLGTYPNTAETAEGNTEPDEPKDLGGNVDLKQLGLSVKPGPGKDGGVVISDVDPNSDAAMKGIKEGDIVLKAGNEAVYFAAGRGQGREEGAGRRAPRCHVPHQEERRSDGSGCHPAQQELSRIPTYELTWRLAPSARECGPPRRSGWRGAQCESGR